MRRILCCLLLAVCLSLAAGAVYASEATEVTALCTVSPDESCQVTVTALILLDAPSEDLYFPLPTGATSVTLNGSRVRTFKTNMGLGVDLSRITGNMAGTFSVTVTYTLPDVVATMDTGALELQVPILAGFLYPTRKASFTVNLPGTITTEPAFSSGYHMTSIEKDLTFRVSGAAVTGRSLTTLKDHETLTLLLPVTEDMFPQQRVSRAASAVDDWGIAICCGLALLYWLLAMRCLPPRITTTPMPPEGLTAGHLRTALTLRGTDLSAMVLTWARLGYILIHLDRHDRVYLYRRMEMGNERSGNERKRFTKLFAKSDTVDCGSMHYAMQCQAAALSGSDAREFAHRAAGNPVIFRGLLSLVGLFGGVSIGLTLGDRGLLLWLLVVLFAILGALSFWHMLPWAECLALRDRKGMWTGIICGLLWIGFSIPGGQWLLGLGMVALAALGGLLYTYGGRRTETGRQIFSEVLGLRRYLSTVKANELQQICQEDPDYFFTLAPSALALGVDKTFSRRFGNLRPDRCPYLTTGMDGHRTVREWNELMRYTLRLMDARYESLTSDHFVKFLRNITKR